MAVVRGRTAPTRTPCTTARPAPGKTWLACGQSRPAEARAAAGGFTRAATVAEAGPGAARSNRITERPEAIAGQPAVPVVSVDHLSRDLAEPLRRRSMRAFSRCCCSAVGSYDDQYVPTSGFQTDLDPRPRGRPQYHDGSSRPPATTDRLAPGESKIGSTSMVPFLPRRVPRRRLGREPARHRGEERSSRRTAGPHRRKRWTGSVAVGAVQLRTGLYRPISAAPPDVRSERGRPSRTGHPRSVAR